MKLKLRDCDFDKIIGRKQENADARTGEDGDISLRKVCPLHHLLPTFWTKFRPFRIHAIHVP